MDLAQSTGTCRAASGLRSAVDSQLTQGEPLSDAVALVVTDRAGNVRYMNHAASQMLKLTREEACGLFWRKCVNIIDESTRAPIPNLVRVCLATGKTIQLNPSSVLVDSHGDALTIAGKVTPFCWLDDDVAGTVIMLRHVKPERALKRGRTVSVA